MDMVLKSLRLSQEKCTPAPDIELACQKVQPRVIGDFAHLV